jgi:hypothetical protein
MKHNESLITTQTLLINKANDQIGDMNRKFDADYQEFLRERKRWKGDFKTASEKAVNNFKTIEGLLSQTLGENAVNTSCLKMILDSIMID